MSLPTPQAAPADRAPTKIVSGTDRYHLDPPTILLARPSTPKTTTAVAMVAQKQASEIFSSPAIQAIIEGIRGNIPKMAKEIKVTRLFLKGDSSPAIRCSSSIIIILRKPYLFLDMIETISLATLGYKPISVQSSTISYFQAQKSFSISMRYLSSSIIMYSSSLFVPKQSAAPMASPSPRTEAKPIAIMLLGTLTPMLLLLEETVEMTITRVVHSPSSPPQTADLMNSPKVLWCQSFSCSSYCWLDLDLEMSCDLLLLIMKSC